MLWSPLEPVAARAPAESGAGAAAASAVAPRREQLRDHWSRPGLGLLQGPASPRVAAVAAAGAPVVAPGNRGPMAAGRRLVRGGPRPPVRGNRATMAARRR